MAAVRKTGTNEWEVIMASTAQVDTEVTVVVRMSEKAAKRILGSAFVKNPSTSDIDTAVLDKLMDP